MSDRSINLVIVTGMSGASGTVAIQSFENLGHFAIGSMPSALVPKFIELIEWSSDNNCMALVINMHSRLFLNGINPIFDRTDANPKVDFKILFPGVTDDELVARYKETRRSHPLVADRRILDGIRLERELLVPLKNLSQNMADTTELTPHQLRKAISGQFSSEENQAFSHIEVMSFGFKYGLPLDADLVFNARFSPNLYYRPELRDQTGLEQEVYDHAMDHEESEDFYRHLTSLVKPILSGYRREGKSVLTITISCADGQHRSVASTHRLTEELEESWAINRTHRDKNRCKETVSRS